MKKILALSLAVLLIFAFSGCAAANNVLYKQEAFTAFVEASAGDKKIRGSLNFVSPSEISFEISEPESIKGVTVKLQNSEIVMIYESVEMTFGSTQLLTKEKNVFENLFEALGSFANTQHEISASGRTSVKCSYVFGEFSAVADADNSRLTSIETPSYLYIFTYS